MLRRVPFQNTLDYGEIAVLIFVNGPFGVGKTTTANLLVERIPHAMVYDPEVIGSYVRYLLRAVEQADDYQDHVLWRILTIDVARLLRETYGRSLVVPMSITRRDYYDAITEGFRQVDPDLACFRLMASPEMLRARILASDDVEAREWRLSHMEHGLAALEDPGFGVEIRTDTMSPEAVADRIIAMLPIQPRGSE